MNEQSTVPFVQAVVLLFSFRTFNVVVIFDFCLVYFFFWSKNTKKKLLNCEGTQLAGTI